MDGTLRKNIKSGLAVGIVLKEDQSSLATLQEEQLEIF